MNLTMNLLERLTTWLEVHWVNPAYSGWLIGGLALFFFGAATNTMAGWLYVISGLMAALLLLAIVCPVQNLRGLKLRRLPVTPVSAGGTLTLKLRVENPTQQPKTLIQIQDDLPAPLAKIRTAIEQIPAQGHYHWTVSLPVSQRGIYHWQSVLLRTAAPLGLFWRQQRQSLKARAVVYPVVLKLTACPLIDSLGQDSRLLSQGASSLATEGLTRTLRPYRWGDSTRLIHWRSSARYGDLRVRELETHSSGPELIIGLDSEISWDPDWFEQAVVAAASLYFYGRRLPGQQASLWTADTGLVKGEAVLEVLAGVKFQEPADQPQLQLPFPQPDLWLTQSVSRVAALPAHSRWLLWPNIAEAEHRVPAGTGLVIRPDQPLQPQLQSQFQSLL